MSLKFSKKMTPEQKSKALDIIYNGLDNKDSANTIIDTLKENGVSYNNKNMYYDIRRTKTSFNTKTEISRKLSDTWFIEVFEQFRDENKMTSKEANKIWIQAKINSFRKQFNTDDEAYFWELYKKYLAGA